MLSNTIEIPSTLYSTAVSRPLSLVDIDNGASVRKYAISSTETLVLKVQNLDSKENPPVGSRRYQIRLEHRKVIADGSERVVSVSTVISTPKSADFTNTETISLVGAMCFLLAGGAPVEGSFLLPDDGFAATTSSGSAFVTRLLTGEV